MRKYILITAVALAIGLSMTVQSQELTHLSKRAETACEDYGTAYGIQPELIEAIVEIESGGCPTSKNGGCIGLMQVSLRYHSDRMQRLGVTDLYDERGNVKVGTDYLAELFREYEDPCLVLDIYNGNSKAFDYYEAGVVSEYANKVLTKSEELERAHGK